MAAWLTWPIWALSLARTALSLLFLAWNISHPDVLLYGYWAESALLTILFSTIGAVIVAA
jgi:hypothetical protein